MPYHKDGYYTDGIYEEDYNQPLMIMGTGQGRTPNAFAQRAPISNGTCYCCKDDHFIQVFPIDIANKVNKEPPLP